MTDVMMNVPGLLWNNLGTTFEKKEVLSEEIIKKAKLDWTISAHPMGCDLSNTVQGYHALYRDDTKRLLGVVNSANPNIVQNSRSFCALEPLLENDTITVETVSGYRAGTSIFGVFKCNENYKILDDESELYYIVVNDRMKPDGKVMILFTPVRIACQNALPYTMSKAFYQVRIPILETASQMAYLSGQIINSSKDAITDISNRAYRLVRTEVDQKAQNDIIEELFPYVEATDENSHDRANESVEIMRSQFNQCLEADNLVNYRGTGYQIYNAITDFTQHYYTNPTKGYDLDHKISILPGVGVADVKVSLVKKALQLVKDLGKLKAA